MEEQWRDGSSSDGSSKLRTDKAEREGGVQGRETGSEKVLMEAGGKPSVEEEYEERKWSREWACEKRI